MIGLSEQLACLAGADVVIGEEACGLAPPAEGVVPPEFGLVPSPLPPFAAGLEAGAQDPSVLPTCTYPGGHELPALLLLQAAVKSVLTHPDFPIALTVTGAQSYPSAFLYTPVTASWIPEFRDATTAVVVLGPALKLTLEVV